MLASSTSIPTKKNKIIYYVEYDDDDDDDDDDDADADDDDDER